MHTRRDFLRNAAVLTGSAFVWGSVPEAIARAMSIDPEKGSTFLDAEHIVILMQENRSFDHCFGALQGVRGYGDPRAHIQPNGNPVWFQKDPQGRTYAPFRLDIKRTNATWIGGLPHSWPDQVDARNGGKYDRWLYAKPRTDLPFTLGHYTREDIPFYYALADAFTVCDQAFCSSLTGTTPNRLFLWTGTIRENAHAPARVQNGDTDYDAEAAWTTYPERLEKAGVTWRVYQNEISIDSGFVGEEDAWLSNFTDNPLEWFTQYKVRFAKGRRAFIAKQLKDLPSEIAAKETAIKSATGEDLQKLTKELEGLKQTLASVQKESAQYTEEAWKSESAFTRALHEKAFTTNENDSNYRKLTKLSYQDGDHERSLQVPLGDTLHQFRQDVKGGKLPSVSWIVAPEHFSDHPTSAWYGAWYVSEVMNILTENPEVWKKTIFILCYDENDGYFDHVPPFVAPFPGRPETGKVSQGIDTTADVSNNHNRESSIGLGFRVPLVIASPWSRGGAVNSEVFDHTSVIQLMETWLSHKGKQVVETNISDWRRTVCGDLSTTFRPYNGETLALPKMLDRDATVQSIHEAKFQKAPKRGEALTPEQIASFNMGAAQESGTRPSCPLPYEQVVNAKLIGNQLHVTLEASNKRFGKKALGSPFNAYSYGAEMICRSYAVKAGDSISDDWTVGEQYHVRVDGPNGFMRQFKGTPTAPALEVTVHDGKSGMEVLLVNHSTSDLKVTVRDESYGAGETSITVKASGKASHHVDTKPGQGWYDFTVQVGDLHYRYAGRLETGKWGVTDPAIGKH